MNMQDRTRAPLLPGGLNEKVCKKVMEQGIWTSIKPNLVLRKQIIYVLVNDECREIAIVTSFIKRWVTMFLDKELKMNRDAEVHVHTCPFGNP